MKKYVLLLLLLACFRVTIAQNDSITLRLDSLLQDPMFETSQVGLMVYDLDGDSALYCKNHRQLMRPASCMKLVTAITALETLGGNYEYQTRIYYTGSIQAGTLVGNLYCVGGFDPTLTQDDVAVMVESVRNMGIDSISGSIVGDRTMKEVLDYGEGWCWDDDNPMLIPLTIGRKDIFLTTFVKELSRQGIRTGGIQLLSSGITPSNARLISSYRHGIDQILQRMMKESDNFYAESMFYQTAASTGRRPAKASDVRTITKQFIKRIGLGGNPYKIADGSGLSLYNYVSAELLVHLLRYAYHKQDINEHLLPALPIAGVDGTLKKRMTGTAAEGNVCAKTGTLTGISSLAGYLTTYGGRQLCFAIINQGVMRNNDGREFQNRVCKALCEP
jgi:D-alanyl-D-alanine carboxypeptidase/D-alanyl-D-alanine-endopeptidase (penicillin-binding protein 4)